MIRWRFNPRTRHPLARLLTWVAGGAALLVLLAFGLFAAAALVIGGAIVVLVKAFGAPARSAPARPAAAGGIIEGEFKVVGETSQRRQYTH